MRQTQPPDPSLDEQTMDPSHGFIHSQPQTQATEEAALGDEESDEEECKNLKWLPWWRRPSPFWLLCALPFTATAASATIAPSIEAYTILVCRVYRPDIFRDRKIPEPHPISFLPPPSRTNLCAADPVVQAAMAKFIATMMTSTGILSLLTAGWWGSFSDRYGRGVVMGLSAMGLLFIDFNFIFVMSLPHKIPGGYWFLLLGHLVGGLLGGSSSASAAVHAYQADTTNDHNRSRIFSLSLGLLFTGVAFGPTLGALLIQSTGKLLSVFYVTAATHLLYLALILFVLPQSLSVSYRRRARAKYAAELRAGRRSGARLLVLAKRLLAFLTPLNVFAPHVQETNVYTLKKRTDWNLTLIALAYTLTASVMGSYIYKFQYAASAFGWTSTELGYWLSLVGASRAFVLAIILPLIIKLFKPKPLVIEIPQGSSESPLLPSPIKTKEIHSFGFDLGLARASLLIEIVAYTFMGLASSPLTFTLFGMLGSLGMAFSPAIQTVTLALYTRRGDSESGRLFGALSVIQAIGSLILGPSLYGFIYVKTVATYPRTIFFVSVGTVALSLFLLSCVRLPNQNFPAPTAAVSQDEDLMIPEAGLSGGDVRSGGSNASRSRGKSVSSGD